MHTIPTGFCMNIVLFWLFPFISKCIIHVLYLLCRVVSIFVRETCTLKYNLQSQCLLYSQKEWQAISKGFVWIQTFHLGDRGCLKMCWSKHDLSLLHGKILHHQRWDDTSYYWIPLLVFAWIQMQTCGFTAARFSNTSATRKLLVTFNHGCGLRAGGLSALHYRPILLQRMYSTAAGGRVAHITCRPLINQTRASSQRWPQLEPVKFLDKINGDSVFHISAIKDIQLGGNQQLMSRGRRYRKRMTLIPA